MSSEFDPNDPIFRKMADMAKRANSRSMQSVMAQIDRSLKPDVASQFKAATKVYESPSAKFLRQLTEGNNTQSAIQKMMRQSREMQKAVWKFDPQNYIPNLRILHDRLLDESAIASITEEEIAEAENMLALEDVDYVKATVATVIDSEPVRAIAQDLVERIRVDDLVEDAKKRTGKRSPVIFLSLVFVAILNDSGMNLQADQLDAGKIAGNVLVSIAFALSILMTKD